MKNDNRTCEIVNDLLPLYVDGVCTESSTALVEEHIETCQECRELLDAMRAPLPLEAAEPVDEIPVVKALKKLHRKQWRRLISVVLVCLLIVVPFLVSGVHSILNKGICLDNLAQLRTAKAWMNTWKEEGAEAAVDLMSPSYVYDDLTRYHFTTTSTFGYLSNLYGWDAGEFVEMEISGETYMVSRIFYENEIQQDPVTVVGRSMKNALETGDIEEFWYELTTESGYSYLLPAELEKVLVERYGNLEARAAGEIRELTTEQGSYFYNDVPDSIVPFPEDMKEKVEGIEDVDSLYIIIGASNIITPELYEYYQDTQEKIKSWYRAYQSYYVLLGEEEFEKEWKTNILVCIEEIENLHGKMTDFRFDSIFRTQSGGTDWRSYWNVTFEDGTTAALEQCTPYDGQGYVSNVFLISETNKDNVIIDGKDEFYRLSLALNVVDLWP